MKFELDPILLDEQAARGRTLIEKLETQWPVAFVVVLLTGDDVGALGSEPGTLRPRVRQNVIFELAFAIAKLTRERVCALYDEGSSMRRAYGSIPSRSSTRSRNRAGLAL